MRVITAKEASKSRQYKRLKNWYGGCRTFWAYDDTTRELLAFDSKKERDAFVKKMNRDASGEMVYVTRYEEYPIYEPAEGGYYYTGREAVEWNEEPVTLAEALAEVDKYIEDSGFDWHDERGGESYERLPDELVVNNYKCFGSACIARVDSRYIGEGRQICIESEENFKENECGWHPYE